MSKEELGARLRVLRRLANKTQSEVAGAIGVSKATYGSWETGRNELRGRYVVPLCHLLSCTPNDLFGFVADGDSFHAHLLDDGYVEFYDLYHRSPKNVRMAVRTLMETNVKARIPRR